MRSREMRLATVFGRAFVWLSLSLAIDSVALADIGRPDRDEGPTKVEVKIFLLDVDDVDGASQSFEANVYYEQRWKDPRLVRESIGERSRPLSDVWHPRIQLVNQQRAWKTFPDVVEIAPSGDVIYRQRVWGSFSQPLLLRDFPFDRQVFEIQLVAIDYTSEEVELVADPKSRISERFSLPDWNVVSWKVKSKNFQAVLGGGNFAAVTLSFEATRRAGYFIGKVIIPLVMIVAMSWVVFWIDPRESGTQISVAITAMLTLIAYRFAVGTQLPKVEYMTRLDLFILGSSILVFASLIQVVVTSSYAKTDRLLQARKVDIWCRWLFPVVFFLIGLETLALQTLL
jgi:hypothetical protein